MIMKRNHATKIRKASKEKGFTLLEVIVAISILSFGLLAVASMQVTAIMGNSLSGNLTEASALAGDRMEKLMSMDYDAAQLDDTDDDGADGLEDASAATADGEDPRDLGIYDIYWNVAENATFNDTKTVNVIVTWTQGGPQKTFVMQGIKGR